MSSFVVLLLPIWGSNKCRQEAPHLLAHTLRACSRGHGLQPSTHVKFTPCSAAAPPPRLCAACTATVSPWPPFPAAPCRLERLWCKEKHACRFFRGNPLHHFQRPFSSRGFDCLVSPPLSRGSPTAGPCGLHAGGNAVPSGSLWKPVLPDTQLLAHKFSRRDWVVPCSWPPPCPSAAEGSSSLAALPGFSLAFTD